MIGGYTTRVVRRLRLVSMRPGKWALESRPTEVLFARLPPSRVGEKRARRTVEQWTYPGSEGRPVVYSLDAAVRAYLTWK